MLRFLGLFVVPLVLCHAMECPAFTKVDAFVGPSRELKSVTMVCSVEIATLTDGALGSILYNEVV